MLLKNQQNAKKPYVVEGTSNGSWEVGMFIDTWKVLTSDLWVLQAVKGFKISFVPILSQDILPTVPVFPSGQAAQVREELKMLLEKGGVAPMLDSQAGFYSNLFLVSKEWPNEARQDTG